jgi:hypothetical protein
MPAGKVPISRARAIFATRDQLRRRERYRCAVGTLKKVTDNNPQLKGQMTV